MIRIPTAISASDRSSIFTSFGSRWIASVLSVMRHMSSSSRQAKSESPDSMSRWMISLSFPVLDIEKRCIPGSRLSRTVLPRFT